MDTDEYLEYRSEGGARPGRHSARHGGHGGDFHALRPFWQMPDAARIDVRRSLLDPAGEILVRQMRQRSATALVVAVDVSASMGVGGRMRDVSRLARAACRTALRAGDGFGVVAFDAAIREELSLLPGAGRSACTAAVVALGEAACAGRSAAGVARLGDVLAGRRCLVLLVSDFWMPAGVLERGLAGLSGHDVAPVVLHGAGAAAWPRAGLMRVRDAESGRRRLVVLRPSLRARALAAEASRAAALDSAFVRWCRPALHVHGRLDLPAASAHLMASA